MKLKVDYPSFEEEKLILKNMAVTTGEIKVEKVLTSNDIFELRKAVEQIYADEKITEYILKLVFATRIPEKYNLKIKPYLRYGASPRASISLMLISKAVAFIKGRDFVTPQDVKDVAKDVLRHRLIISYEAEAQEITSDDLINIILEEIPVP
jgi:MoxR-like ATPase